MLSYAFYVIIKKNNGIDFMSKVLEGNTRPMRELIVEYISPYKEKIGDIENLYLHEVIGYNEIDTEQNILEKNKQIIKARVNNHVNYVTETDGDSEHIY
jgi:hypothetical protein